MPMSDRPFINYNKSASQMYSSPHARSLRKHSLNLELVNGRFLISSGGRGSLVIKISDRGWHVTSPLPLKTHRVGERCTLNLSRAQTSSRWGDVVDIRGGCQFRCRPRHLTMVQNDEVRCQKPSCRLTV
ncbi:uncharacterized protein TNCV_4427921 [Trichonephila clavipes]|nr:uncharacterized protein TNCV_4427921 [Trichonephila clavipes]